VNTTQGDLHTRTSGNECHEWRSTTALTFVLGPRCTHDPPATRHLDRAEIRE
jgi:hypothetical protein